MTFLRLVPAALLALSLTAMPALAQADHPEIRALDALIKAEAMERVVESIAERLAKTDAAKAELVRAKAKPGEAFLRGKQMSQIEPILAELFKAEIQSGKLKVTDLKFDMHLHRGLRGGYQIRELKLPGHASGFQPPRSTGYPAEVAAIDNKAPHSMHDLHDYLSNRFTKAALDRLVTKGYTVELHAGTEVQALADLKNRGAKVLGEIKSPMGNYERMLVAELKGGEIRYVITGDLRGMDRIRHLSALLRFAGPQGKGVPNAKVQIVGDMGAVMEREYRSMREGFASMGAKGDMAIIGFRGTLRNELMERALARRGLEYARDVLGSNAHEGLIKKVMAERDAATGSAKNSLASLVKAIEGSKVLVEGLSRSPERVFAEVDQLKDLIKAEKTLAQLQKKHPESKVLESLIADGKLRLAGGVSSKGATISRNMEFNSLRAEEIRVQTPEGTKTVRLVNNYYGDAMSGVIRGLLDSGHRKIAYFGTAGGTANGARVGDIHIPEALYDWKGQHTNESVRNSFLDYFNGKASPLGKRLHMGTKLGNVYSPAVETMAWLQDVKAKGFHAVEVENGYIGREVSRHNAANPNAKATLHTSVIISDVPGSHQTLGNSNGATTATFEKMVDHYLEALGIKDIQVTSKEQAKPPADPLPKDEHRRRALEVAEKLIPRQAAKSKILRGEIADLLGKLSLDQLKAIDTTGKLQPSDIKGLDPETQKALEAEVKNAYTDRALYDALNKSGGILGRMAQSLQAKHPNAEFKLRVGGGVEGGRYSPAQGLTVEVVGPPEVQASAKAALAEALAGTKAKIALGKAPQGIEISPKTFATEARPLLREYLDRALKHKGFNHQHTRVEYSGRDHLRDPKASELFSRFDHYNVGPKAGAAERLKFENLVRQHGGEVERVRSGDPRLRGAQGRTVIDSNGKVRVYLPSDRPVQKYALVDELTHVRQLERLIKEQGAPKAQELFKAAAEGDPTARAKLLDMEIRAKRMVKMTLPQGDPNRALLDRQIEALRKVQDPYLEVRKPNGRVNWEKARAVAKTHAQGAASFLLGLFLKDLAKVVQTGDRAVISEFFDGLATTQFWEHYGLFVVGAEAGSAAYTRYLARHVKPAFVSGVLKSNIALASGMALPELIRGKFDGKTFAINFTGFMLSSAAVKAGLAGIKWVTPLGNLSRYQRLSRFLKVARGVPGWVYAGVETAVVLYFGEAISAKIDSALKEREARREVAQSAQGLLDAARRARGVDDPAFQKALEESAAYYAKFRDRSLEPAMAATAKFQERLAKAGRQAATTGTGVSRFNALASRYPNLVRSVERVDAASGSKVDAKIKDALERFERERAAALRAAYTEGRRSGAYDPVRDPGAISENRAQGYDDEAALYRAAAARATDPEVKRLLSAWAAQTLEIKTRERALLDPTYRRTNPAAGAAGRLPGGN